jgi:hypothetical protein
MSTSAAPITQPRSRPPWLFPCAAVVFGLALLVAAEVVCRMAGWGGTAEYEDPFVGFKGINPLFEESDNGERFSIPKAKLKFFSPESFPAAKGKDTFRVFCLGGSTVKGRPYAKETAFSTWLKLGLRAAEPKREWEVVNCGGISYASYRLVHILRECLAYRPDLFVICTGHNEFLEDRTYEAVKQIPDSLAISQHWASRLQLYQLLRSLTVSPEPPAPSRFEMAVEVEALLDYRGGLEVYDRNEGWRDDVVRHFGHNLRAMIAMARAAGVPVILIRPPANLRSSPPFKSQHRDGLGIDETLAWEKAIETAQGFYRTDLKQAVTNLQAALAIDDRFAATHYGIGKCYEMLGQRQAAIGAFERALDEDICPLRMIEPLVRTLGQVSAETKVGLIDAHALLEQGSRFGILGNDQLVDHVHPTIDGHKAIAGAILSEMEKAGWVSKAEGWTERREVAYRKHFNTIDSAYFAAARRALHGLNEWAAGRAEGMSIESRPSPIKTADR